MPGITLTNMILELTFRTMYQEMTTTVIPFKQASSPPDLCGVGVIRLRNKSWKPECLLSFNMGWLILLFYPEPEARDKIHLYPPTHVNTQNPFWLPWIISIPMSKGTNTVVYFDWKTVSYTYACAHNSCCQIRADDNSSTCTFTTGKSVTCTGACANEIIHNR